MTPVQRKKTIFALFFGNRGVFPGSLIEGARKDLSNALHEMGHETLMLEAEATRLGAVETPAEGKIYAEFLRKNAGKFGGVIICLPNFGDENGALEALRDVDVPIFVQAYPDALDQMAPAIRRDAFCGKCSITDVFYQAGIKTTCMKPHTVHPSSDAFRKQVDHFDRVCQVYNGLRKMRIGAIGARVTAFKTVRIDEVALQRHGITVETYDLSDFFKRANGVDASSQTYTQKRAALDQCGSWGKTPDEAKDKLTRAGVALDQYVTEFDLDAVALRCWNEFEEIYGVAPCMLLGEMNDRLVTAACEVDVGNAVAMHALTLAAYAPPICLDWNNNYADDEDKCILFHCGPVPPSLMVQGSGEITPHAIISNSCAESCTFGCNQGRIQAMPMTFASMMTWDGHPRFFAGEGAFTDDAIPKDFFGCAGVAQIDGLQDVMLEVCNKGFRHHVSVAPGHVLAPTIEALEHYLGYEVFLPQQD